MALPFFAIVRDTAATVSLIERIHDARLPGLPRLYQLPYLADFLDHPDLAPRATEFRGRFGIEPGGWAATGIGSVDPPQGSGPRARVGARGPEVRPTSTP